jgi:hypothetical protein
MTNTSRTPTGDEGEETDSEELTEDELRELAQLVYNLMLQEIRQERERG